MTPRTLIATALLSLAGSVFAQAYPARPVTLIVPFPPGGGTDTGARIVAQKLGTKWGQTVIVENKGGAAGMIGSDAVAKAKPDGYTLLMGNIGTQSINPSLYKKMPYDTAGAFAPVALVAELPLAMMVTALEASGQVKSGKLRALAVTGERRVPALPEVPTLAESAVPGFNSISWIGVLAPAGTPADIVQKISADLREVLASDEVKNKLIELGAVPAVNTPLQFAALIEADRKRYAQVIRDKKITVD